MSLYIDSSALLKRCVEEDDSGAADRLLRSDPSLLAGRHTIVEVRRNPVRLLSGPDLAAARATFTADLGAFSIIELDAVTCEAAAAIAEVTRVRTVDALHLAVVRRVAAPGVAFLTFDLRQAQAARSLGLQVLDA